MVMATWLADAARMTGYPVVEVEGWKQRGSSGRALNAVEGVVLHHTAGAARGDYPSFNVVKNGRAGLSGPLSQIGLGRSGTIYIFAAGRANHAGTSRWAGFSNLNGYFIGIEAESVGYGKDWTQAQIDAYPRLVAAILHYIRRNGNRAAGHREVGLPLGRKTDPAGISMVDTRELVDRYLSNPASISRVGNVVVDLPVANRVLKYVEGKPQMTGQDVEVALKWAGIGTATASSYYGPKSKKAVAEKQARVGLDPDGVVGPKTWKVILKGDDLDMEHDVLKRLVREVLSEREVQAGIAKAVLESPVKSELDENYHPLWLFIRNISARVKRTDDATSKLAKSVNS